MGSHLELLLKVVERGATFGKEDGNGLGLSHAKTAVVSWGGMLEIDSGVGRGTTVTLEIPLAEPPRWFLTSVQLKAPATVIVLDDDPGIHGLWEHRFSSSDPKPDFLHFYSPDKILAWFRQTLGHVDNPVYLIDYDMGSSRTGLDVIEMTGVTSDAILVTSSWEDTAIRNRCEKLGVRLLPKSLAPMIAIEAI